MYPYIYIIQAELLDCKTIIWNGPMGVFEMEKVNILDTELNALSTPLHTLKRTQYTLKRSLKRALKRALYTPNRAPWESSKWKRSTFSTQN